MSHKVFLLRRADLKDGEVRKVVAPDGCPVAVYRVDGQFYATHDTCTHATASLSEGEIVDGDLIACPVHDGMFHIPTGQAVGFPCEVDIQTFRIVEEGDDIHADLSQPSATAESSI
jgi:ethylbenzene dioxygenase ferredoxin subunit